MLRPAVADTVAVEPLKIAHVAPPRTPDVVIGVDGEREYVSKHDVELDLMDVEEPALLRVRRKLVLTNAEDARYRLRCVCKDTDSHPWADARQAAERLVEAASAPASPALLVSLTPLLAATFERVRAARDAAPLPCNTRCAPPRHTISCTPSRLFEALFNCEFLLSGRMTAYMAVERLRSLQAKLKTFVKNLKPTADDIAATMAAAEASEAALASGAPEPEYYFPPGMRGLQDAIADVCELLPFSYERKDTLWNAATDSDKRDLSSWEREYFALRDKIQELEELVTLKCDGTA